MYWTKWKWNGKKSKRNASCEKARETISKRMNGSKDKNRQMASNLKKKKSEIDKKKWEMEEKDINDNWRMRKL